MFATNKFRCYKCDKDTEYDPDNYGEKKAELIMGFPSPQGAHYKEVLIRCSNPRCGVKNKVEVPV